MSPPNSIDAADVEAYLHEHIPISSAMGIGVRHASLESVALSAPLEPNVNHRSTVFGGSCASVAILAAWTLTHLRVTSARPARVVIRRGATEYLAPIDGEFVATCREPEETRWEQFLETLVRRGRARIDLEVTVTCGEAIVAEFQGTYVALAGVEEASGR